MCALQVLSEVLIMKHGRACSARFFLCRFHPKGCVTLASKHTAHARGRGGGARQVFDVELHAIHNCRRRQIAMFSDMVCDV